MKKNICFVAIFTLLFSMISIPASAIVAVAPAAIVYTLGSNLDASIGKPGEIDNYVFKVGESMNLDLFTTGDTDTYGTLKNENGTILAEADDISNTDKNFNINVTLEPGAYYLDVKAYYPEKTGKYTLGSKYISFANDDFGNSIKTAKELEATNSKLEGSIDYNGDIDFFAFNVKEECSLTISTVEYDTDTFGTLYDSEGNAIAQDDDSNGNKNFIINKVIQPGTYYVSVKDYYTEKVGKYILTYTFEPFTDDYGNTLENASGIESNGELKGIINYSNDVDVFKFSVSERSLVDFSTSGTTDTYGTIFDEKGNAIASDDDSAGNRNFKISTALDPGTYFLSVKGYYATTLGDYVIRSTSEVIPNSPPDDYSNEMNGAQDLSVNSKIQGYIGVGGDIDFFVFKVGEKSDMKIYTDGSTDTFGALYDEKGNTLATHDDMSDTDKNFNISIILEPGVYYVSVKDYYSNKFGDYVLVLLANPIKDSAVEASVVEARQAEVTQ